jgi:hypothetical protein
MYQVGFGDCFLVSFGYRRPLDDGRSERHMLVDFGSTHGPKGERRGGPTPVERAAALIAEHTGGRLDVVVVSHRHRDHLSGFGDAEVQAVIEGLEPQLVVRPWTEHPDLPRDAEAPLLRDPEPRAHFADKLAAGHRLSDTIETLTRSAHGNSAAGRLSQLALDQVPNPKAIAFLDELSVSTGGGEYLSEGGASRIEELIPGTGVRVLGPPTIEQHAAIKTARENDPDEFWLTQLGEVEQLGFEQIDTRASAAPPRVPPGPVAWIADRLARQQVGSLQRIVRTVDDALNNTSLILLVDAGDKRLLLPGDAQIENWSWALDHAPKASTYRRLLSRVDLYKVGHHGSRNATPKSLFALWESHDREMTALMSTKADVHGDTEGTAVPRGPLVEALKQRMDLVSTDDLPRGEGFVAVAAPCSGDQPFSVLPGG